MPELSDPPAKTGGKVGSFFQGTTAGLPNWAWLLVIGSGIALAFVVPRFFKGGGGGGTEPTTEGSGLGLAVDPTTGLPYAVEGLVPSGAFAGGGTVETPMQTPIPPTSSTSTTSGNTNTAKTGKRTRHKITGLQWDVDNKGIPVRDKPGGKVIRSLGYNARVGLRGTAIKGPGNLGTNVPKEIQSYRWYPIEGGGYVSAFDVDAGAAGPESSVSWPYAETSPQTVANNGGISVERLMALNPEMDYDNVLHMGERYSRQ